MISPNDSSSFLVSSIERAGITSMELSAGAGVGVDAGASVVVDVDAGVVGVDVVTVGVGVVAAVDEDEEEEGPLLTTAIWPLIICMAIVCCFIASTIAIPSELSTCSILEELSLELGASSLAASIKSIILSVSTGDKLVLVGVGLFELISVCLVRCEALELELELSGFVELD